MSHFTVIVIGDDHEKQLAPYHEFECTGRDDEYVQDIDITEKARTEYEEDTDRMFIRDRDGAAFSAYDDQFYRDPTPEEEKSHGPFFGAGLYRGLSWASRDWGDGKGYRGKIHYRPEGFTEKNQPSSDTQTFLEWCKDYYRYDPLRVGAGREEKHKYGFVEVDKDNNVLRVIDRTNPNDKWGWYVVGGRWRGFFPLKRGVAYDLAALGSPGVFERMDIQKGKETTDHAGRRCVDIVRVKDVDFDRARNEAETKACEQFAKWRPIFEKHGRPESWKSKVAAHEKRVRAENISSEDAGEAFERMRNEHNGHPAIKAADDELQFWGCPVSEYGYDEEAYVRRCRNRALIPYAFVKDSKWFGKGDMGFFGISRNEINEDEWCKQVQRMFDDLPPDTLLTLIDCHI